MVGAEKTVVLVENGRGQARVVVADEGWEAAELLVEYVEKSTGARLEIKNYRENLVGALIHVGVDPYVEQAAPDLGELDEDGFVIRTVDSSHLIIAGPTPRGTEYGVCEFLERFVGVRWLLPGPEGEHVSEEQDLIVPATKMREEPAFQSREQSGGPATAEQQLWGRRQRLHSRFKGASHSVQSLFPPKIYAKSHPQFFPVVDGERFLSPKGWDWHPCFTAEGLAEEAARNIKTYFRAHPEETSVCIGISDGVVHCECEGCRDAEQGRENWLGVRHVSEQYFAWANRVTELVLEEFPDKWLGCLGYTNTFQAPSTLQVHPRLVVFHTYDRHKWIHPDLEREGHQLAEEWGRACPSMGWYDYTFGGGFMVPRVYFHHLAVYLRYGRDTGVMAVVGESCHNWAEAPKWYLMARLYWNPDLDVNEVLRDWYEKAVGPGAAPYLAAYYRHWEVFWTGRILASEAFALRGQQWLPVHQDTYFDVLKMEDFVESRRLLEEAVARAGTGAQQGRARMLLRGFEYYEACAQARLPDVQAGCAVLENIEDALALVDQAPAALDAARRRQEFVGEWQEEYPGLEPVLAPSFWPALEGSGWGRYSLWRAFEWLGSGGKVRARVEEMAGDVSKGSLAAGARALLQVVDGSVEPLVELSLGVDSCFHSLVVDDTTRLSKEPGDRMDNESWWLTVGDDVIPFWNGPHPGRAGQMRHQPGGGRSGRGAIVCEGIEYGTIRKRLEPLIGMVRVLCFVRVPRDVQTRGQVRLNLWPIYWSGHNPCPHRMAVCPQPGVWTPIALTARLENHAGRPIDYLLCEIEVRGFEEGERLEVADVALWPAETPEGEGRRGVELD